LGLARIYRFIESSLVALFAVEAVRIALGILLPEAVQTLNTGGVSVTLVFGYLGLILAMLLPTFAPQQRETLPDILSASAIAAALGRIAAGAAVEPLQLIGAIIALAAGGVYGTQLIRANANRWATGWVVGLTLDQLLRAANTYDLSLRTWQDVPVLGGRAGLPMLWGVVAAAAILIAASRLARRNTTSEPFSPGKLTVVGGIAFGGFLAFELLVLSLPNAVARWAGLPHTGVAPWLVLATALPLSRPARQLVNDIYDVFSPGLQGWAWLVVLLILVAVGNRLSGVSAAAVLIFAQFVGVSLLWHLPEPNPKLAPERTGSAHGLGMLLFFLLAYDYALTIETAPALAFLQGQGVWIVLVAAALLCLPRIFRRVDGGRWEVEERVQAGLALTFVIPAGLLAALIGAAAPRVAPTPARETLRVATYNINYGRDADGNYDLELAARTIAAARPDVVMLQEVDTANPANYGVDQATYLGTRLRMHVAFYPAAEQTRGVAVLSRWPLSEAGGALLPAADEQAVALYGDVNGLASGQAVRLVNARLSPASEQERLQQVAFLLSLANVESPAVVAGDLAAPPDEAVYAQIIFNGFTDPDETLGIEQGFTTPARLPAARNDYVLVRGLTPLDARQVESEASDHRLVVVEVAMGASAGAP
jgi:endonuclease/exonuclease/phosphatase family metal-dependent hydrolase